MRGDAGAFSAALGIGLLWAARNPYQHRVMVGMAAIGSFIHAANHAYDDLAGNAISWYWFGFTIPLFIFAAMIALAYWFAIEEPAAQPAARAGS